MKRCAEVHRCFAKQLIQAVSIYDHGNSSFIAG
jgi:hypothetical protein